MTRSSGKNALGSLRASLDKEIGQRKPLKRHHHGIGPGTISIAKRCRLAPRIASALNIFAPHHNAAAL